MLIVFPIRSLQIYWKIQLPYVFSDQQICWFYWRYFFVNVGIFAQLWKYQTIWYAFPTIFPIRILQNVLKNSTTICFFWSAPPIWRFFRRFFWRFFFSESGDNFALQRTPLLTEFSEIALRAVTHVKFKQTVLYDVPCCYLEFNHWYCLVFFILNTN